MTEVKMIRTVPVSLDGIRTQTWHAGSTQNAPDDLLAILIGEGAVEIVENKAHMAAPENKIRKVKS